MPTPPPLTPARDDSGDYLDVDAYAGHAFGGSTAPARNQTHAAVLGSPDPDRAMILGSTRSVLGGAK